MKSCFLIPFMLISVHSSAWADPCSDALNLLPNTEHIWNGDFKPFHLERGELKAPEGMSRFSNGRSLLVSATRKGRKTTLHFQLPKDDFKVGRQPFFGLANQLLLFSKSGGFLQQEEGESLNRYLGEVTAQLVTQKNGKTLVNIFAASRPIWPIPASVYSPKPYLEFDKFFRDLHENLREPDPNLYFPVLGDSNFANVNIAKRGKNFEISRSVLMRREVAYLGLGFASVAGEARVIGQAYQLTFVLDENGQVMDLPK